MNPEGEGRDFVRQLRDDATRVLTEILPKAAIEILDKTVREYVKELKNELATQPMQPISNQSYAQVAGKSHTAPQIEMQHFNEENRWYMNNMYHKPEVAYYKQTRCESLTMIYEECQKLN